MHEAIAQLWNLVFGVWRFKWVVLAIAWVIAVIAWLVVWRIPEAYVANARIYVDTNSVLRPLLKGLAIQPDMEERIAMMSRTLLSRPNLEHLMRMTDLDLSVNSEAEREAMVASLNKSINLSGDRRDASLYSISVEDSDREMAQKIAQSLITVFIENSQSEKRDASSGAQTFLDDQIRNYETRLAAAENRLAAFKQEHIDVLPGSDGGYYERLQIAQNELDSAKLELSEAVNRRNELQSQIAGEQPVFLESSESISTSLDARIQALRLNLDALLARYTERHPEVRQVRGLLIELEAEQKKEREAAIANGAMEISGLNASPLYQAMRGMLAETEGRVAELRVRVAEYDRRVESLRTKVSSIPEVETELKQLDRDYSVLSSQHQQLLQRRESARLSEDVEQKTSSVAFRVIDPPFVPMRPSKPNKVLLNAGGLLVGIGTGVAAGLLLSLFFPVFNDPRTVATATGLPLLGVVTLVQPVAAKRREYLLLMLFLGLAALLVVVFLAISFGPLALA